MNKDGGAAFPVSFRPSYQKRVRHSVEVEYPESSLVYIEIDRSWNYVAEDAAHEKEGKDGKH